MTLKHLSVAAVLLASLAGAARADDVAAVPDQAAQTHTGDRQRLRDGSGAGGQYRYGAQSGAARGTCDGTMRRDQLRDGSGAGGGGHRGRMGGRR